MKINIFAKLLLLGCLSSMLSAIVVSKDGIAKDSATGLEWQDERYTDAEKEANSKNINNGKAGNWEYVKYYCENLNLGRKNDWRIPNVYEILTLFNGNFIVEGFKNLPSDKNLDLFTYWFNADDDLYIDSNDYQNRKTFSLFIRCVRGKSLNYDTLTLLKNKNKIIIKQRDLDYLSPNSIAKRKAEFDKFIQEKAQKEENQKRLAQEKAQKEAREQAERERHAQELERQKFQLGNKVCSHTYSNNSGWCGTIENISGERIQVELTNITINSSSWILPTIQLNPSNCSGNKTLKYGDEGKYIWVPRFCID